MNPVAARIVRAVKAAKPDFDALAEFDSISELDRLAREMCERPAGTKYEAFETPVVCGNVKLYPITIGARHFSEQFAAWFPGEPGRCDTATLFAMAHCYRPATVRKGFMRHSVDLADLDTPEAAKEAVSQWARRCTATAEELLDKANSLLGNRRGVTDGFKLACVRSALADGGDIAALLKSLDESAADKTEDDSLGGVLSFLCEVHGETPEYWLWHESESNVFALLTAKTQREIAKHADTQRMARETWEDESHRRFWNAAKAFGRKHGVADVSAPPAQGGAL